MISDALIDFIISNRGRAAEMNDAFLRQYVSFHWLFGYLKVVEEGGAITGFAVGRRANTEPTSRSFTWDENKYSADGKYFIIGDLIATTTTARKKLAQYFLDRWPDVSQVYGHDRRGNVKRLSRRFIERLRSWEQV